MKNRQAILLVFFCGILFVSCDSATTQDLSPMVDDPSYTANIEKIMSVNCTGCHAGGNQYPNLDSYTSVKDATQNGDVLCRIGGACGNIMPQSGALPKATITIINTWANKGYKVN